MKIRPARLAQLLSASGFELLGVQRVSHRIQYWRRSQSTPLHEAILVDFSGKRREAVAGYVYVSVAKWVSPPGSGEIELLRELATEKRGHAIVESTAAAIAWEKALASLAPERAARLAELSRPTLLETTRESREAATKYFAKLDTCKSADELVRIYLCDALPEHVARSEWWANRGQMRIGFSEDEYILAGLCLLRHEREVEARAASWFDADPRFDAELARRIQFLVELMLEHLPLGPFAKPLNERY